MLGVLDMKLNRIVAVFVFSLALAACQPPASDQSSDAAPDQASVTAPVPGSPCPVTAQNEWRAVLRDGATPALTVSGSIELPTPGYAVSLARDANEAANTTEPHLTLTLTPPGGMVTQVLTAHPVYYFAPATGAYTSIHIICEGLPLTTIAVTAE
jgi:hypothetical protein